MKPTYILGFSRYYHDSAACLVKDGAILAAAQEERFNRKKHFPGFPRQAIRYCLREAGITLREVDQVVFYEKPFIKFERLPETYLPFAPKGLTSFLASMPAWLKEKIFLKDDIQKELSALEKLEKANLPPILLASTMSRTRPPRSTRLHFGRRSCSAWMGSENGRRRRMARKGKPDHAVMGDSLVLENCVLHKADQKPLTGDADWRREFELD